MATQTTREEKLDQNLDNETETMKRFVIDFDLHISDRKEIDAMTADEAEEELNHILSCGDFLYSAFDGDVKIASIEEVE